MDAALQNVHQHGWTEDAIAHGKVSNKKKYPPSSIGMMHDNQSKASDSIHYFMKECNLKDHLQSVGNSNETKESTESESFAQIMLIMFPLNMVDYPMFSLLLSTQFFWC